MKPGLSLTSIRVIREIRGLNGMFRVLNLIRLPVTILVPDHQLPAGKWEKVAVTHTGRSRHELSGQRMNMKPPPASGRASALRVNIAATSTPIFKTRNAPCRIAIRGEMEK